MQPLGARAVLDPMSKKGAGSQQRGNEGNEAKCLDNKMKQS